MISQQSFDILVTWVRFHSVGNLLLPFTCLAVCLTKAPLSSHPVGPPHILFSLHALRFDFMGTSSPALSEAHFKNLHFHLCLQARGGPVAGSSCEFPTELSALVSQNLCFSFPPVWLGIRGEKMDFSVRLESQAIESPCSAHWH